MGISSILLFSFLVGIVISESPIDESVHESLVPVTIFITDEQYHACKEYGHCTFTPQSVTLNEPEDIDGKFKDNSYFELCRKIHFKMEMMEAEHPEVEQLKLKLMQLLDSCSSEFEFESGKSDLMAIKFLDTVKHLIEKLRVEFEEKTKVSKPEPIPIVEPIPIEEEITAEPEPEPGHPMLVGSLKGIPGIHFPNYSEIPITSFSCSDKTVIPGFYADLETGCQVFHLCYEHRRESFLCPIGTIFNQPILACDYWYSANCSQAPNYYEKPNIPDQKDVITDVIEEDIIVEPKKDFFKFIPVTAKVTDFDKLDKPIKTPILKPSVTLKDTEAIADKIFDGILSLGSHATSKARDLLHKIPEPQYEVPIVSKSKPSHFEDKLATKAFSTFGKAKIVTSAAKLTAATKMAAIASGKAKVASAAAIPIVKAKVVSAAIPLVKMDAAIVKKLKAKKLSAATIPIVKAKVASAATIPIVKAKVASAAAIPIVKAKVASAAAIPIVKAKVASAAAIPIVKAKVASAAAIPIVKAKVASAAAIPIVKAKVASAAAIPIVKAKVASAAIPLMKMDAAIVKKLKAKKFSAAAVPIVKAKVASAVLPLAKMDAAIVKSLKAKKMVKAVPYLKVAPLKLKSAVALPIIKTKFAAAAVSPLTKKALALGYLKLLKAKKLAVMG